MKQEFKWILNIELEINEDEVGTDNPDRLYDEAAYAFEIAQDRFFDNLNSNDKIESWKIINWE